MGLLDGLKNLFAEDLPEEPKEEEEEVVEQPEEEEEEDSPDLATFREYQANVQQAVNDAKVYTPEEVEQAKTRLSSTITGNSYLAMNYEKEYPDLKKRGFEEEYKKLADRLASCETMEEVEKVRKDADKLKQELYEKYDMAKRGVVEELQQAEAMSIVTRERRHLLSELGKESYLADLYHDKYQSFKEANFTQKYNELAVKVSGAKDIATIDALKKEFRDIKDQVKAALENAPLADAKIQNHELLTNIYEQLANEDLELLCGMLGYKDGSKAALTLKERAHSDYEQMIDVIGEDLDKLYAKRDAYLKSNIRLAFFLKCLKVDAHLHNLEADEMKEKRSLYRHKEFDYPDAFKTKVRKKLSSKYLQREEELPLWLLDDEELDEKFETTYSVAYRVQKMRDENAAQAK